jgi:hypothetical protein
MRVIGLDGREYKWNIGQYNRQRPVVSKGHQRARDLLKSMFPMEIVLEELTLPGGGRSSLYADFFLSGPVLMVEVHGKQHFEFNSYHYKSRADFVAAQVRDKRKAEWCELNGIRLVILKDEDSDDEWRR